MSIEDAKQAVRERVWRALQDAEAARFPGARGRIPNFVGAETAAGVLAGVEEWTRADVLKCNPDSPQLPVRTRALEDGKAVYMAVPKLREPKPFIALYPSRLDVAARKAASIKGSSVHGQPIGISEMGHVDLVVCGTVAVNPKGVRVGKGGGYSDLEFALLSEAGLVDDDTVIATTVHPVQVLDEDLPETTHDFRVDLIVTSHEVIRCRRTKRPPGIVWDDLTEEKIASIPVLHAMR